MNVDAFSKAAVATMTPSTLATHHILFLRLALTTHALPFCQTARADSRRLFYLNALPRECFYEKRFIIEFWARIFIDAHFKVDILCHAYKILFGDYAIEFDVLSY